MKKETMCPVNACRELFATKKEMVQHRDEEHGK